MQPAGIVEDDEHVGDGPGRPAVAGVEQRHQLGQPVGALPGGHADPRADVRQPARPRPVRGPVVRRQQHHGQLPWAVQRGNLGEQAPGQCPQRGIGAGQAEHPGRGQRHRDGQVRDRYRLRPGLPPQLDPAGHGRRPEPQPEEVGIVPPPFPQPVPWALDGPDQLAQIGAVPPSLLADAGHGLVAIGPGPLLGRGVFEPLAPLAAAPSGALGQVVAQHQNRVQRGEQQELRGVQQHRETHPEQHRQQQAEHGQPRRGRDGGRARPVDGDLGRYAGESGGPADRQGAVGRRRDRGGRHGGHRQPQHGVAEAQ